MGRTRDIDAIRKGEERFPIERIYLFAQSLGISPGHLLRLAFESYYPEITEELAMLFGFYIATPCKSYVFAANTAFTSAIIRSITSTRSRVCDASGSMSPVA